MNVFSGFMGCKLWQSFVNFCKTYGKKINNYH